MKTRIVLSAPLLAAGLAAAASLVDMSGRRVDLPAPCRRAYSTSPVGEIFLYSLAPDAVVGLSWTLRPRERSWLEPGYANLPVLGGWFGKSASANLEEILKAKPDVVVSGGLVDAQAREEADRLQARLGIPVVVVDSRLGAMDSAWRFLGRVFGRAARADSLSRFSREVLDATRGCARAGGRPAPKVYYAEGPQGLQTDAEGSLHTEILEWVGAANVARVPVARGFGRSPVSLEQILAWQPDWILVGEDHTDEASDAGFRRILGSSDWRVLRAVREGRLVRIPDEPFNWFDRPPAPNRLPGLLWLARLWAPRPDDAVFRRRLREYYRLFLRHSLTPAEEARILSGTLPAGR